MISRLLVALLWLAAAGVAAGPAATGPAGGSLPSKDLLESRLKEVEAASDLDEKSKATLGELYRKTQANLEAAQDDAAAAKAFTAAREKAPVESQRLQDKLDQARRDEKPPQVKILPQTKLGEIEQLLLKQKADYAAIDAKLGSQKEQLALETARPEKARQELTEARHKLDDVAARLSQTPPPDQSAELTEARRWNLLAQTEALTARINRLDQELLSQPARIELLKAQRNTSERNLQRTAQRVKLLEDELNRKRRSQVEKARAEVESAQGETRDKPALVKAFAEENARLSAQLNELTSRLEHVATGDETTNDRAKAIEDEFRSTQQKLEVAGLSQALGQVLLEQRRQLPEIRSIRKAARAREDEIARIALAQIQLNEQLRLLADLDGYVESLTAGLDASTAAEVRTDLLQLAETRASLLAQIVDTGDSYLRALGELDYAQTRLLDTVVSYDDFLAERLLWVRSSPAPSIALLLNTPMQVMELLSPGDWLGVGAALLQQAQSSTFVIVPLLAALILLWKRPAMRRALTDTGKPLTRVRTDKFRYSVEALLWTLLLVVPIPLLLWTSGWLLATSLDADAFQSAVARALVVLSPAFFYLSAFRGVCRPNGLAIVHFRWSESSTRRLRAQISILMAVFLPAALVAVVTLRDTTLTEGALARIAFIVAIGALSWFFYRLFGSRKPVLAAEFSRNPDRPLARYRRVWLALALIIPVLLAVLAVSGFLYTAGTLTGSLIDTLWLILGFVVVHQMAVRWLLLVHRKLALEAALERRRAALAEQQKETSGQADELPHDETELEQPEVDLAALNQESLKLLNTAITFGAIVGLWVIWSDVLPAFGRLESINLWHFTGTVDGEEAQLPVTLADVLLALLITAVTVIAARRFPSLLEIVLLKRVSVTPGGRYTATTLARYIIGAAGFLLVFNTLGLRWSQIQWMAAALSVGIGFGLQEIVANFISGLIILFERPIRVGDVVTVGDTDGMVTRIEIRATTIRTWDRQELLVPNKEFITGRLLNWSLSDQTTRIRVPVGVAYGSNVQKAMDLMREVADKNRLVLTDPKPYVIFTQFGDNTLNLELRCFVGVQDDRLPAISQLHEAINDCFNSAGIVIAFPQRDVHLDTAQPLDVRILRTDT